MVKIFSGDDTDFKGDQRLALTFAAPDVDFSGCTAEVEFLGQKRTFAQVANGGRLTFAFSADETRGMKCGVWPVIIRLRDAAGRVRTVDNTQRIKVTNDVNEAYADAEQVLAVSLLSGGVAMPEIPAELDASAADSVGQFKNKYNTLLALLRNVAAVAVIVLFGVFSANAASVATAPLDDIPGTAQVVTNVDLSGLEPGDYATVSNRAMNASRITTNDVCAIVTNEVHTFGEWVETWEPESYSDVISYGGPWYEGANNWSISWRPRKGMAFERWAFSDGDDFAEKLVFSGEFSYTNFTLTLTRTHSVSNVLGFARLSDIPTNNVRKAEFSAAMGLKQDALPYPTNAIPYEAISGTPDVEESDPVWSADKANYATKTEVSAISNEASVVYRLYSGSNVVCEVTNYNSAVHAPELRLMQLTESNAYITVWTETNGLTRTYNAAKDYTDGKLSELPDTYAPRAWSRTTSGLGVEAPTNTTWISTPTTVIAGGYEPSKYITSGGAIWLITSNGMAADFSPATNNTAYLNISATDGTPMFRIEKTDSYLVGVNATSVTTDGAALIVGLDIVAADHPLVRVRESLSSGTWAKEEDTIPSSLATVTWSGTAGAYTCRITNNTGGNSLFAYFEYLQEGGTKVKNEAVLDVSANGILCTDGIHKCRPVYNNGSITWEVVQ